MHDIVKDYYGKVLTGSEDLQTNACCTDDGLSDTVKKILSNIHDEVMARYYGCGLVTPELLTDCNVLDLGCGAGRDCYALAQMVGERGSVIGVDMTDEQLAVANAHIDFHREKFNYAKANTTFVKGYIEKLDEINITDNSIDIIVSNCVINLSPDKESVLREAYRILKNGGEVYFSDVYADRRVPQVLQNDPLLYGECLSGALYWNDFENLAKKMGFATPRIVTSRAITIDNEDVAQRLGEIKFTSVTYRLFKAENIEAQGQDYKLKVAYKGSIAEHESSFNLDQHTPFISGKETSVDSNTWQILKQSRLSKHFTFINNLTENDLTKNEAIKHYGLLDRPNVATDFDFATSKKNIENASCCTPTPKTSCC
jgi:ubiquinone/menaquinone biosynthesis C-methylase UbiE